MQMEQTPHKAVAPVLEPVMRERRASAKFVSREQIAACVSFRDAVCLAWDNRAVRGMTQRTCAELLDVPPSHMSNMLNRQAVDRHGKARQDLPARLVAGFQRVVGNDVVSQWLTRDAQLTLLEEMLQRQQETP